MPEMTLEQAVNLALQHQQQGRFSEAEFIYRRILSTGRYPNILNNLGNVLLARGFPRDAIAAYQEALVLEPGNLAALANLGHALAGVGRHLEAISCCEQALRIQPGHPVILCNLGNSLMAVGRVQESAEANRQAIAVNPDYPAAHNNLASALRKLGRYDESITSFREAIRLNPGSDESWNNLACLLYESGQINEAVSCYRQAMQLNPANAVVDSNYIYSLLFHPDQDPQSLTREHTRWNQRHAEPLKQWITPHANDPAPGRRLRIGYVSPDFRNHVIGRNILPLLREHDRAAFEIFCYSSTTLLDSLTDQFHRLADAWRDITTLNDHDAADLIRRDSIDILVDLALHLSGGRPLIFARKPAPVQVTFAGYPGSTGMNAIDYRLTDPWLDPPGLNDDRYSEVSVRLPETFWCYEPLPPEIPVNDLPAAGISGGGGDGRGVTFGCLNNYCKVTDPTLRLWARVLREIPSSRLMMLSPEGSHRTHGREILNREGISIDRIDFFTARPLEEYLKLYHRMDIALDTLPYNGHTTSLDALWMGVPVITLVGDTVVGRAGVSQLTNLGLPELIATTSDQFVGIARGLAGDLPRLANLRSTLRQRMLASPLMNAPRFARNIESAFRAMWKSWCSDRRNTPAPGI